MHRSWYTEYRPISDTTRDTRHATRDTRHATRDARRATRDARHSTRDTRRATRDTQPTRAPPVQTMRIILDYYIGKCKEDPDMLSKELLHRDELTSLKEADLRQKVSGLGSILPRLPSTSYVSYAPRAFCSCVLSRRSEDTPAPHASAVSRRLPLSTTRYLQPAIYNPMSTIQCLSSLPAPPPIGA